MLENPTQRPPVPLTPDRNRGRRGLFSTSYGDRTTPEQALAVAVILQAIEDLQSADEDVRWEAHEFWLQPKGPWAEMRRFFFQAVNLDDEWLHKHLSARLEPPERPAKKWSYSQLLEILPTDRTFTAAELCRPTGLPSGQIATRLRVLKDLGHVFSPSRGVYCVSEFEATWRAQQAAFQVEKPVHTPFKGFDRVKVDCPKPMENAVIDALRSGRETVREVGFDVPSATVRETLDALVARGLVEKDGPRYRILQDAAA